MLDLESSLGDVLLRGEPVIPPAPATVRALSELEARGDLSLSELRRYAFADPAVATELLAAANRMAGVDPVVSLPAAEERIGEAALVRLVREVVRKDPAAVGGPLFASRRRAWRGAVVSAMLCRELARDRGVDPEEAYACGLLHDAGRAAALRAFERLAAGMRAAAETSPRRWDLLAERWHIALGTTLAERHHLPRAIFEAIAFHHPERTRLANPAPLLRLVRNVAALSGIVARDDDASAAVEAAELAATEAVRVARTIDRIHEHIADLERRPAAAVPLRRPAGESLPALREPRGEGVRLRLAGREYVAVGFARHQLLVTGPAPLGEGALLEVEVLDRRREPFHARVLTAWAEGARFGAILLPLGLTGPSLADIGGSLPAGPKA
jgi:HD-like signal output (HDOD) protein